MEGSETVHFQNHAEVSVGHQVNVNRVYRLYVEQRLMVRRKRRKRLVRDRTAESRLTGANQEWAMDFIF
jgi:putative transposase